MPNKKNSKAQFYMFTAVLLCSIIFAYVSTTRTMKEADPTFNNLAENFIKESPEAINNALYNETDKMQRHTDFMNSYISYSRTKDPDFQLVSLLKINSEIKIDNQLKEAINVSTLGANYTISSNSNLTIEDQATVGILFRGNTYTFNMAQAETRQKAIFFSEKGNEIHIKAEN